MRRPHLLATLAVLPAAFLSTLGTLARADDVPADLPRMVLDTGRIPLTPAEPGVIRFEIHGEEQMRVEGLRSFLLDPTATVVQNYRAANPGGNLTGESIGQNVFLTHWLRLSPTLQIADKLSIIGQIDLTGMLLGDLARDVWADRTPRDGYDGYENVQPRWLYLEWLTPVGLLRAGQMGAHWGMGLVANDGDHPSLFGDYRYGNIVEQVLFATKPLGEKSPFVVALAGNLVYRDNFAILVNGDQAWQGVLAAYYEEGPDMLGLYGVYRSPVAQPVVRAELLPVQRAARGRRGRRRGPLRAPRRAAGRDGVRLRRLRGRAAVRLDQPGAHDLPAGERHPDDHPGLRRRGERRPGVHRPRGHDLARPQGRAPRPVGSLRGAGRGGLRLRRRQPVRRHREALRLDPDHKVGLLLFDEIMRWQTARASTAAQDPNLANSLRPTPGSGLLPSNGGVYGAQYVYPTAVYRPRPWFDLKAGAVIAQTTADVTDPYRLAVQGSYINYEGGNSSVTIWASSSTAASRRASTRARTCACSSGRRPACCCPAARSPTRPERSPGRRGSRWGGWVCSSDICRARDGPGSTSPGGVPTLPSVISHLRLGFALVLCAVATATPASDALAQARPFPQSGGYPHGYVARTVSAVDARTAYESWKSKYVKTDCGAGSARVEFGSPPGSTVSEGMGYGMVLAAYHGDRPTFDGLWRFVQRNLASHGMMGWKVTCSGFVKGEGGEGSATDGDTDIAFALVAAVDAVGRGLPPARARLHRDDEARRLHDLPAIGAQPRPARQLGRRVRPHQHVVLHAGLPPRVHGVHRGRVLDPGR